MCFIPGADPVSSAVIQTVQARKARKDVEHSNRQILSRQGTALRVAAEKERITTGSGKDPARQLVQEIKRVKSANELASNVGLETNIGETGLNI